MNLKNLFFATATLSCFAASVSACSIMPETRTLYEIKRSSLRVSVDAQCGVTKIGVNDRISLGSAEDLGNGRIQQVVGDHEKNKVLVADCNTRELTMLRSAIVGSGETSCGITHSYAEITGPNSTMSMTTGRDLHELVEIAEASGMRELSPNEYFFEFSPRWPLPSDKQEVWRKDRFNLLCGCKIHYPDSAGAKS